MNYQQKSRSGSKKRTYAFESSRHLGRNLLLFLSIGLPSVFCFGLASAMQMLFFGAPGDAFARVLELYLSDPFYSCVGSGDSLLRILLCASPMLLSLPILLSCLLAKKKLFVLRVCGCILSALYGLWISAAMALFQGYEDFAVSAVTFTVYIATELVFFLWMIVYSYRLSLCLSDGFPSRRARPQTGARFCSFTFRFVLWIFFLVLIQIGTVLML